MNKNKFAEGLGFLLKRKEALAVIALLLMLMFNLLFTPGFFKLEIKDGHLYGSLVDIVKRGSPLMFLVLGMTLVIATGSTDVSVGSIAAITAAVVARLIGGDFSFEVGVEAAAQTPMLIAISAGLMVAVVCGVWNGFLVAKLGVQALVATLMFQVAGRGVAQLITQGTIISIYYKPFAFFGSGFLFGLPVSIYVVVALSILMFTFINRTSYGLFLQASGSNRSSSGYAGIKVKQIIWIAFIINGLMAGVAGILIASEVKSADCNTCGLYLELDAILAVVLGGNSMKGGKCSIGGSLIGALLVQTLTTSIYMRGVQAETILLIKAVVVILVGIIQTADYNKLKQRFDNVLRTVLGSAKEAGSSE